MAIWVVDFLFSVFFVPSLTKVKPEASSGAKTAEQEKLAETMTATDINYSPPSPTPSLPQPRSTAGTQNVSYLNPSVDHCCSPRSSLSPPLRSGLSSIQHTPAGNRPPISVTLSVLLPPSLTLMNTSALIIFSSVRAVKRRGAVIQIPALTQ